MVEKQGARARKGKIVRQSLDVAKKAIALVKKQNQREKSKLIEPVQ